MQTIENEEALLEKAKAEEKAYNWVEAARLYEQVAESFLNDKLTEQAGETCRMLGTIGISASVCPLERGKQPGMEDVEKLTQGFVEIIFLVYLRIFSFLVEKIW